MSDVEFVVKLRDAATMIADAATQYLEKLAPKDEEKPSWDPSRIKWEEDSGSKGPYERYPAKDQKAKATDDFKDMLADLKAHNGKLTRDGLFYWVFSDQATVGRKKQNGSKASETKKPEKISDVFPEDLRNLLSFEEKADACIIRPRQFLGSENFAKIASIVQQQNGDYVSAGKESHFRIPFKK